MIVVGYILARDALERIIVLKDAAQRRVSVLQIIEAFTVNEIVFSDSVPRSPSFMRGNSDTKSHRCEVRVMQ
jgi:hypothetical protein